ncbi:MAG: hypothetical protein ACH36H_12890 [Candidatus Nanopelagicales bacterium]
MIRNERFDADGRCVEAEIVDLAAGTVTYEVDGKVVESRQLTPEEAALPLTAPPSDAERLAALEATNAALLAALAKATTVAQIRAAATAAQ